MKFLNSNKFFSRYLPMFLSVVLIVAATFVYLVFRPGTPAAEAAWYSTGGTWNYRKVLTIDHTKIASTVGETYVNFPVLVSITDTDLKTNASSTGADILFTAVDGTTKLAHEIESYNSSTGALIAWVNAGSSGLSTSTDTSLYMYYGNSSAADQSNKAAVWANYAAVYHLPNGTTISYKDSTANGNNMSASSTPTAISGEIDGAAQFVSGQIATTSEATSLQFGTGSFTASTWYKSSNGSGGAFTMIYNNGSAGFRMYVASNHFQARVSDGTHSYVGTASAVNVNDGSWHYLVEVVKKTSPSAGTLIGYVDGTAIDAGTAMATLNTITDSNAVLAFAAIGFIPPAYLYTTGTTGYDEARISSSTNPTILSADWIKTEYTNQSGPATFLSEGLPQNNPSGAAAPANRGIKVQNSKVIIKNAKVKIQPR